MVRPSVSRRPAGLKKMADPSSQALATAAPAWAMVQVPCSYTLKPCARVVSGEKRVDRQRRRMRRPAAETSDLGRCMTEREKGEGPRRADDDHRIWIVSCVWRVGTADFNCNGAKNESICHRGKEGGVVKKRLHYEPRREVRVR